MSRLLRLLLALAVLLTLGAPLRVEAQGGPEDEFIARVLAQMSTPEKVGQLFMVPFLGNDVGPESDIADLIQNYHVGAVVLLESNGNIVNSPDRDTPVEV
ncbi:MAG: hypothetical protein D6759_13325, partial [Chloroflexi bacterium]